MGPARRSRFGLVNNAGISRVIPHEDLAAATPNVWQELHEANVVAPFRLVAEAQSALREAAARGRPGCVVNVSSHAGVRPKGASIPYAATKAALNHVTRLLALSLAPDIRVNAVAPGLVDTPLTADWTQAQQLWKERSPMRRAVMAVASSFDTRIPHKLRPQRSRLTRQLTASGMSTI
jgi:NAD(P)-dependent dehydrogenase (short-subunit alcohol dehydrogenase family)